MNSDTCILQFLFYDVLFLILFFTLLTSSVHNNKWLVFIVNGFEYFFLLSGAEVSEAPKVVLSETQPVGNASQVSSYATFMVSFRSFHEKSFNAFLSYWPTIRNGTRDVFGLVGLDGVSIFVSLYSPSIWHWLFAWSILHVHACFVVLDVNIVNNHCNHWPHILAKTVAYFLF